MMIYLHIPFCLARCSYCDFNSYAGAGALIPAYLEALKCEMAVGRGEVRDATSLYIGGGTPSLLSPEQVGGLIETADEVLGLAAGAEVTVEVNPATWDERAMREAVERGVNRISLGMQSLDDSALRVLGRPHDAAGALQALDGVARSGASTVSADLMYGIPGQTLDAWEKSLRELIARRVHHISAYALTLEEGTTLAARVAAGELQLPDEEEVAGMYLSACEILREAGYEHYEISNFCLPGCACRHNEGYWSRTPYLGCGAGAHSFDGNARRWSPAGLEEYIAGARSGELRHGRETLDASLRQVEEIMLGLRTARGIAATAVEVPYEWELAGLVRRRNENICLTDSGMLVSNELIGALLARA